MNNYLDACTELYIRGHFDAIPLGKMPNGSTFYPTKKQIRAMELLADDSVTHIGYGGSARCFTGDTLVQTDQGHKRIDQIQKGNKVLSWNSDGFMEWKKVLEAFCFKCAEPPKIAIFRSGLKCTHDHEFLFGGEWTKAGMLAQRAMEARRRSLSHIKSRETGDRKLAQHRSSNGDEASESLDNKGCCASEIVEAREITNSEIEGIQYEKMDTLIYDLHVECNHNYTVTKDNIIVHNSGKSIIETTVQILECNAYAGIAWGLGRLELTRLKRTVLITFFNQLQFYGVKDHQYNYNQQLNKITFENGSEVFLIDTQFKPSDPLNTRFNGYELTRCALDESNETDISVVNKLFERCGWRKNEDYGIGTKMFETFNPDKNHVNERYWIPFRDNEEPKHKKFIQALPADNPHPAVAKWIDNLMKTGDIPTIERQVHGNFDYDDDPSALVRHDEIMDVFTNTHVKPDHGDRWISSDIALLGRDKFVIISWAGLVATVQVVKSKSEANEVVEDLEKVKNKEGIPNRNVIVDTDGTGSYVKSYMRGIVTYHAQGKTLGAKDERIKYGTINDQVGFKLADLIRSSEIYIICSQNHQRIIAKELAVCLRKHGVDKDGKAKIIPKEEQKKLLQGKSPDFYDALKMRMMPLLRGKARL